MNSISSSKNGTLLLITALAMALLFALYSFVVKPKQEEVHSLRTEINNLNTEIVSLEENMADKQSHLSETDINELTLRKKVPNDRKIDSLILSIEEIEYVTGSQIRRIEFNNYDTLVSNSNLLNSTENSEDDESQGILDELQQTEELPVSTISEEQLPQSLKLVTFIIEVTSPNETSLLQFIKEIEQIERIMHIDSIDFDLAGEEDQIFEDISDVVTAEVQVTTFYYE